MPLTSIHHASSEDNQTLDLFVGELSKNTKATISRLKDKGLKIKVRYNGGE